MKRITALLLALCCLLSACAAPQPETPPPSETVGSTPAPTPSTPPEPAPGESEGAGGIQWEYLTEQVDLSKLTPGVPLLSWEIGPADWSWRTWSKERQETWGYDARSFDLSGEDLSDIEDRNALSFDTRTVWPEANKLPAEFDPEAILELGKDPGLGIRALHAQGITGEGVGIAIIDQSLYAGHEQYRDNLMLYESYHNADGHEARPHASALASIAVGKDTGVAPGAKLYYIASTFGEFTDTGYEFDAAIIAACIDRVLEINRRLPEGEKIRVISISKGVDKRNKGFEALAAAIERAGEEGIFVLTVSPENFYEGFDLMGMERECMLDPNDPASYTPAAWIADQFPSIMGGVINVPMGARTYASCGGEAEYEWTSEGGMSWAVPWLAGFYALCCQVKPELTGEEFILALQEASTFELLKKSGAESYSFGKIIDPAAVIVWLKAQ